MEGRDRRAGAVAESAIRIRARIVFSAMRARLGADVQAIFRTFRELNRTASSSQFDDAMMRALRMTVAALHQRMNKRFTRLGRRIDARFKAVDERIDARFKAADARFDAADARFDTMDRQLREVLRGIDSLGKKLDSKTRGLDEGVKHCLTTLDLYEKRITDLESPPAI